MEALGGLLGAAWAVFERDRGPLAPPLSVGGPSRRESNQVTTCSKPMRTCMISPFPMPPLSLPRPSPRPSPAYARTVLVSVHRRGRIYVYLGQHGPADATRRGGPALVAPWLGPPCLARRGARSSLHPGLAHHGFHGSGVWPEMLAFLMAVLARTAGRPSLHPGLALSLWPRPSMGGPPRLASGGFAATEGRPPGFSPAPRSDQEGTQIPGRPFRGPHRVFKAAFERPNTTENVCNVR